MPNNAIQVVLNADNFITFREPPPGGGGRKDFFEHRDSDFLKHKAALKQQVGSVAGAVSKLDIPLAYVKVSLRRSALAKSHRPFAKLLVPDRTPIVGGNDLGQVLARVSVPELQRISKQIDAAEPETRMKADKSGKLRANPSVTRSEVGAVEDISLYASPDRVSFDVSTALAALKDPRRGGSYHVELFEPIPLRSQWDALDQQQPNLARLFKQFAEALKEIGPGLVVDRLDQTDRRSTYLSATLYDTDAPPVTPFEIDRPLPTHARDDQVVPLDLSEQRHAHLLNLLARQTLVKKVSIAPAFRRSKSSEFIERTEPAQLLPVLPESNATYPTVGIIDGGIDTVLQPWVIARWGFLHSDDIDAEHGTFIGGLLVYGSQLNGSDVCCEADGCRLADIDIMPREDDVTAFGRYFPKGSKDFFEELEQAVLFMRVNHGVRIFNLSINGDPVATLDSYSYEAQKLDAIAESANVIIVVSAGNEDDFPRPEWDANNVSALAQLAAATDDRIRLPAETVRNISVSAMNPPGVRNAVSNALACYSRRGPALRAGVKPDFGHYGGAHVQRAIKTSGLFSIAARGGVVAQAGTSYAAPLIAKTAASLDAALSGQASRETLTALMIHHARVLEPINDKVFTPVARHLVGFGTPCSANQMLTCDDDEITLVFAARLMDGKRVIFPFVWPPSLTDSGKCRGVVRMTLVYSPPLDHAFGAEFARVNLDAHLQQEDPDPDKGWNGKLKQHFVNHKATRDFSLEADLIADGMKWSPTKIYQGSFPRGVGKSSNWRIEVEYLTRALTAMPQDGIPFTLVVTITDPDGSAPVFEEMRQTLQALGEARISDIRTASRIALRT